MKMEQTLHKEIEESQRRMNGPNDDTIYRRDRSKRIELINWVLENMKNSDVNICAVIERKMNEIIDEINKKHSIIEQDPLDSELRILDWIIPFSSSFLIFSRFDGRTHEGLRWVESYGYHVNTNKKMCCRYTI
jgi:hypothetical protein